MEIGISLPLGIAKIYNGYLQKKIHTDDRRKKLQSRSVIVFLHSLSDFFHHGSILGFNHFSQLIYAWVQKILACPESREIVLVLLPLLSLNSMYSSWRSIGFIKKNVAFFEQPRTESCTLVPANVRMLPCQTFQQKTGTLRKDEEGIALFCSSSHLVNASNRHLRRRVPSSEFCKLTNHVSLHILYKRHPYLETRPCH